LFPLSRQSPFAPPFRPRKEAQPFRETAAFPPHSPGLLILSEQETGMAAILTIASGFLGLLVGLVSLLFGASLLTAFLLWVAVGIAATVLGIALSLIPSSPPVRARS
jgi:VIT1/CCC1 family predicted Fe2+/Mn2+ transporter